MATSALQKCATICGAFIGLRQRTTNKEENVSEESPLIQKQIEFANKINFRSLASESCDIELALNRVCYSHIPAPLDSPPYARAIVEGFLVNTIETQNADESSPVNFTICGEIQPGDETPLTPKQGEAIQISTGSIIPDGNFSAVRMWEAKKDANNISITRPFPPRFFIEEQGCEIKKNDVLISAGDIITPKDIGTLASMGISNVPVSKKVNVTIFSSGDEVISHTEAFKRGHIYDSNSPMLSAAVQAAGGIPITGGIQSDDFSTFVEAAGKALSNSDMLLISGGTAVGGKDFISDLINELGELIVDGVPMRSGRPLIMGIADNKPIVCVAGYPPEALRGFTLFGKMAMDIMSGHSKAPTSANS